MVELIPVQEGRGYMYCTDISFGEESRNLKWQNKVFSIMASKIYKKKHSDTLYKDLHTHHVFYLIAHVY